MLSRAHVMHARLSLVIQLQMLSFVSGRRMNGCIGSGVLWEARRAGVLISDRVQVSALMLGAVAGVAEGFLAARVLAQVRLLSCVAPQVDLQVLQA